MEGLLRMEDGDQILPFVRMFCGNPSTFLWEDEMGVTQSIPQGEGGEQGDPLMPMLFALGQHQALVQTQARLGNTEKVMAFLDDIVISTHEPVRVTEAHTIVAEELWSHARIQVHFGKTQVKNRGGIEPQGMEDLTRAARRVKPDAVVWKGDPHLPPPQQGLRVLGVPIGQPEFIKEFLVKKKSRACHALRQDPMGQRPSGRLPPPAHEWVHQSQLLVEGRQTRFDRGVCNPPRQRCVEVSLHHPRNAFGSHG